MTDERVYVVCSECSWGCSGPQWRVDDKADEHEASNPGHKVRESAD